MFVGGYYYLEANSTRNSNTSQNSLSTMRTYSAMIKTDTVRITDKGCLQFYYYVDNPDSSMRLTVNVFNNNGYTVRTLNIHSCK